MSRKTLCWLMLSMLTVWSCGDDDGGGGGAVSSGLPNSQKLSELNTADAKKACVAYRDAFAGAVSDEGFKRYSCYFTASIVTQIQAQNGEFNVQQCEMLADQCIDKVDDELDAEAVNDIDCEDTSHFDTWKSCDATVGDFESCATFQVNALAELVKSAKCEKPELDEQSSQSEETEVPAACKPLYDKCGEVFRDMADDSSEP